ncbi:L,D-transpeptidase catalytic domain-containing protein [Bifidobacterium margollesii]|uniref:L,D-transpeptidase catalytic domain-containing protein n=1 Tax=Bifidobacterium margollesii TaxID=2020964 RepID=A0A2N5J9J6_9BIFI|nr:InlB B-repeat-containing protein [Bifidobacterium margollesii]PLS30883.1 L,D-transpeptidase catalytic domain-containing protein [Bifidobacterium margollesii]
MMTGRLRRAGLAVAAVLAMLLTMIITPVTGASAAEDWSKGLTQAQIRSSYGFAKWVSVTGETEDIRADARRAIFQLSIGTYGYINLGADDDATSLDNTRRALQEDIKSNQFRTSLENEPCRTDLPQGKGRRCNDPNKRLQALPLNLQFLARSQDAADAVAATNSHHFAGVAQNISFNANFKDFYNDFGEKDNYDKDMTDGKLDSKASDGSKVGETGHYLNYVDGTWSRRKQQYDVATSASIGITGNVLTQDYMFDYYSDNSSSEEDPGNCTNQGMTLPESLLARFDQYTSLPEVQAATGHTVRFDSAGGSPVAGQKIADGHKATRPADPTRSGYTFAGWYLGATRYDFSRPVTSNLTLTARWTRNAPQTVYRTVRFDSAGGSPVAPQKVRNGARAGQPKTPTRSGYSFAGWYLGSTKWDFNRPVTGDLTLTAHWTKNATPSKPTDKPGQVKRVPVYRVYNRNSGLHHYTTSKAENDMLVRLGWRDENHGKSSFITVSRDTPGARPVYREYNRRSGNHNWTLNKREHDMLVRLGWRDEGIAWYTSPTGANVYRLYNPKPYHKPKHGRGNGGGEHVYTTSYGEYLSVIRAGWRGEGVAWKSL